MGGEKRRGERNIDVDSNYRVSRDNRSRQTLMTLSKNHLKISILLTLLVSQSIYSVTTNVPPNLSSANTFTMNAGDELIVSAGGSVQCTSAGIPVITVTSADPTVTITSTGTSISPATIENTNAGGPIVSATLTSANDVLNITNNTFSSMISNQDMFLEIELASTAGTVNFNNNGGTVEGALNIVGQHPNLTTNITNSGTISNFYVARNHIGTGLAACNLSIDNSGSITNAPSLLGEYFVSGSDSNNAITYTITNQVGGTVTVTGAFGLIDTLTNNSLATWNITNNGTMTTDAAVAINIQTGTATINMGANASTTGAIQGTGGTTTLNFNGNYTLGGDVTDVQTINSKAGTLNMGSHNITGFTNFTVFNGATTNFSNTVTGTSILNNGTINFNTNVTSSYINNSIANLNSSITGDFINNNGAVFNVNGNRILTGNYTGNSGSTIGYSVTTPATFDSLQVSGVSTLNANSIFRVTVNNNGAGVGVGDFFDVYLATTPQTLPQVTSASAGYTFIASQNGNNIRLTITGVPPIPPPTPSNSTLTNVINLLSNSSSTVFAQNVIALSETGISILLNSNSSTQSLVSFWNQIASLSPESAAAALNQVAFNENSVALLNVTTSLTNSVNILQQLFSNLSQNISLNQERISSLKQPLGYIAGDSINPCSSFGLVLYGGSERQNVPQVNIFPSTTTQGGIGLVGNYAFNEIFNSGIGFSYVRSHSKINNINAAVYQPMNIQSYQITNFYSLNIPEYAAEFDFNLSFADNRIHQVNSVIFPGANLWVRSQYNIKQFQAQWVVSKEYKIDEWDNYFIPIASLSWNHLIRNPYRNNPSPIAQSFSGIRYNLLVYSFGFSLAHVTRNNCDNIVGEYEGHINYFIAAKNPEPLETAAFLGGGPPFVLVGIKPYSNTLNFGASASIPIGCNFSLFGLYDLNVRRKYISNALTLKINWDFY